MADMKKVDYRAISTILHDGKAYAAGATLALSEDEAAPLLAAGAVEPVPEKKSADKKS